MAITESVADYLEAIMVLQREKGYVRAVDIANYFGYSRPTVSQTLKSFRQKGYVEVDEDSFVKLTELGQSIADATWERHTVLTQVLMAIGVTEETAKADACRIEHDISDETFRCIREFYERQK
ncbi:MAG: metal-dependent transcriptional regulator [Oscillospiraceae bacterium]|nr:metal-dependent transcriptional regulator [Oscillospiraceae bacterium]MDD6503775.1 metal-dependent transcriptional regulator [Oscillospiraceae bacterium]MDY4105422.1 metal-dependent transcriptional regulator [Oscillospiraceae bacterium]